MSQKIQYENERDVTISRSCLEDFLARIPVMRGCKRESMAIDPDLYLTSCDSSWMSNQIMHYLRMSPVSARMALTRCSKKLPKSGMMRNGILYELPELEHPIKENGSSLLPTPSGTSNHHKNHVVGRLDEWGGSSNPFRGTQTGKVRCARFEEWMMGLPMGWTELIPSEMQSYLSKSTRSSKRLQTLKEV